MEGECAVADAGTKARSEDGRLDRKSLEAGRPPSTTAEDRK